MSSSTVDVLAVLCATRSEAMRNAAVLDHISSPTTSPTSPVPHTPISTSNRPKCSSLPPQPSAHNTVYVPQPASEPTSDQVPPTDHQAPSPTLPISKNLLLALFAALDADQQKAPSHSRYAFVKNDQDNHLLYGSVLPVISRLLAVSFPGLLCIVQLPRPDLLPAWSIPPSSFDGYASHVSNGSNGSNESKSGAHTTLSPQRTSRTPSPSNGCTIGARHKSLSPEGHEAHPRTEDLIRRADEILSGREAATKRANQSHPTEEGSPPPESVVQDHRALRLICNGFEVLTAKMPRPKHDMGSFTLASVGWDKAGIVSPEHPTKGVSMSFSNGMMTPTEGIVVTFSNGSMCFLTLGDPLSALDSLKVCESTPVVVFSFACIGQLSVGDLLKQNRSSLGPEASRIRAHLEKPNVFVLEVGYSGGASSNGSVLQSAQENRHQSKAEKSVTPSDDQDSVKAIAGKAVEERAAAPCCPPIVISIVPRAVPLFVNTINRTFIDPPYYDVSENSCENELANDKSIDVGSGAEGIGNVPISKRGDSEQENVLQERVANKVTGEDATAFEGKASPLNGGSTTNGTSIVNDALRNTPPDNCPTTSDSQANNPAAPHPSTSCRQPPVPLEPSSTNLRPTDTQRPPALYNYYGYGHGHGHVYPGHGSQAPRHHPVASVPPRPPIVVQHSHHMNRAHNGYYQHVQTPKHSPGSLYHHHPSGGYPQHYFPIPPLTGMIHPSPQGHRQWHPDVPQASHHPAPFPPPHPMDARRDMPVHFASHQAVLSSGDARYPSHYYGRPSNPGQVPRQVDSSIFTGCVQQASKAPNPATQVTVEHGKRGRKRVNNGEITSSPAPSCTPVINQQSKLAHLDASKPAVLRNAKQDVDRNCDRENDAQGRARKHALDALIQMRHGVQNGRNEGIGKRPREEGVHRSQLNEGIGNSNDGSEQRTSSGKAVGKRQVSTDAFNSGASLERRVNGKHSGMKNGESSSPQQHYKSRTNSSTYTSSQSVAVENGSMGESSPLEHSQKRIRKR